MDDVRRWNMVCSFGKIAFSLKAARLAHSRVTTSSRFSSTFAVPV
jgi:hypothetical protein